MASNDLLRALTGILQGGSAGVTAFNQARQQRQKQAASAALIQAKALAAKQAADRESARALATTQSRTAQALATQKFRQSQLERPISLSPGASLVDPVTRETISQAPFKPPAFAPKQITVRDEASSTKWSFADAATGKIIKTGAPEPQTIGLEALRETKSDLQSSQANKAEAQADAILAEATIDEDKATQWVLTERAKVKEIEQRIAASKKLTPTQNKKLQAEIALKNASIEDFNSRIQERDELLAGRVVKQGLESDEIEASTTRKALESAANIGFKEAQAELAEQRAQLALQRQENINEFGAPTEIEALKGGASVGLTGAQVRLANARAEKEIVSTARKRIENKSLEKTGYKSHKDAVDSGLKIIDQALQINKFDFLKGKSRTELGIEWVKFLESKRHTGVTEDKDRTKQALDFMEFLEKKQVNAVETRKTNEGIKLARDKFNASKKFDRIKIARDFSKAFVGADGKKLPVDKANSMIDTFFKTGTFPEEIRAETKSKVNNKEIADYASKLRKDYKFRDKNGVIRALTSKQAHDAAKAALEKGEATPDGFVINDAVRSIRIVRKDKEVVGLKSSLADLNELVKASEGQDIGYVKSASQWLARLTRTDEDVGFSDMRQRFKTFFTSYLKNLSGSQVTEFEEKRIKEIVPQTTDSKIQLTSKINSLREILSNHLRANLDELKRLGYDGYDKLLEGTDAILGGSSEAPSQTERARLLQERKKRRSKNK